MLHPIVFICLLLFCISIACAYGQKTRHNLPAGIISQQMDSLFPGYKNVTWKKKGSRFKADFIFNNRNMSLVFKKTGRILNVKYEVAVSELPEPARMFITENYHNYKTLYIFYCKETQTIYYEILVMKGDIFYILNFDQDGIIKDKFEVIKENILVENILNFDS